MTTRPKSTRETEKNVPTLEPIAEETSEISSQTPMSMVMVKLLETLERMERRQIAEEVERQREKSEKDSGQMSSQIGSSNGVSASERRPDKASIVETPERFGAQLFIEKEPELDPEPQRQPITETFGSQDTPYLRRLEIPLFDGEGVETWVTRVEQYFEMGELSEKQKLSSIKGSFTGEALDWYMWERDRDDPFLSWDQLRRRLLEHFSTHGESSAGARLLQIKQEGSVKDYCREFIGLAANATEIQEHVLELAFMNGLKPVIQTRLSTFEPRNLQRMMKTAKKVDCWTDLDEMTAGHHYGGYSRNSQVDQAKQTGPGGTVGGKGSYGPIPTTKPINSTGGGKQTTTVREGENRIPKTHNRVKPPFRRLTPAEIDYRKAKKLCFRCDEEGHSSQFCTRRELQILVVEEEGSEWPWDGISDYTNKEKDEECEIAELSLNSMVGISSPRTMKLRGTIRDEPVVVKRVGLVTEATLGYGVVTGTGIRVQGMGVCNDTELELQGLTVVTTFLPLELGTADVILGMQWLETLGEMRVNWKLQIIKFELEGTKVELNGDPTLCCSALSMKALWKALADHGEGMIVEYGGL